ncbi:MAG: hypothetical protein KA015_06325 [Spirochaetes bacterium]|nr:hypothetical protein [Spirochaetota bacterium]
MKYFRIHSNEIGFRTQQPVGLFVAIWTLVDKKILSEDEISEYWIQRKWFEENLPVPPFYNDGNSINAITWYKNNDMGNSMYKRMNFYLDMAAKYNMPLSISVCAEEPGRIVYEDDYQIGVVDCVSDSCRIVTKDFLK